MHENLIRALGSNKRSLRVFGIIFLIIGVLLSLYQQSFPRLIFGCLFLVFLFSFTKALIDKVNNIRELEWNEVIVTAIIGLILGSLSFLPAAFYPVAIFLLLSSLGLSILYDCITSYKKGTFLSFFSLSESFFYSMLGAVALFEVDHITDLIYLVLGSYFITFGILRIKDSFLQVDESIISSKRLGLPILFSLFLPVLMLNKINHRLRRHRSDVVELSNGLKNEDEADLEIWIHTARKGIVMVGHVDISFGGVTYSYGPYDPDSAHVFGLIGDGVLFKLSSKDYLDSLAIEEERAVFGYGIRLTKNQKDEIVSNLKHLMLKSVPFNIETDTQKQSYLGQLSQKYLVNAYKFSASKFKTYFLLTTNCVLLADAILDNMITDIIGDYGILTPGSLQEYLEQAYDNPNSNVVSRFVFGQQDEEAVE